MTTYASWDPIILIICIALLTMSFVFILSWNIEKRDRKEHENIFCGIKDLRISSERLGGLP